MDEPRARKLLTAERDRLIELRASVDEQVAEQSQSSRVEELPSVEHPGDVGTDTHDRARDLSIRQSLDEQLSEIEAAFERLEQGIYGICEGTGEAIPDERLEAQPAARYTASYQQKLEDQDNSARPATG